MRRKRVRRFRYGGGTIEFHGRYLLDVKTAERHLIEKERERVTLAMLRVAIREIS